MILKNKQDITQALLHEYLNYDPITGHLSWKKKLSRKVVVGNRAGCLVKGRDARILKIFGHVYIEHRIIWLYVYGHALKSTEHIDHINHNESDNSISNLRLTSQKENNKNLSKRSDNSTGVTGVWFNKRHVNKPYTAEIKTCSGKKKTKSFATLDEAKAQRKVWESEEGYHLNHGIIKP